MKIPQDGEGERGNVKILYFTTSFYLSTYSCDYVLLVAIHAWKNGFESKK